MCQKCGIMFKEELNASGFCKHIGKWHSAYKDCSYVKCAFGLGKSIGKQHWSCCFAT